MKRATLLTALLPALLAACGGNGGGSVSIIGVDPKAELSVDITGLPAGAGANVTVQGPGGTVVLTSSKVFHDLPLGTYTVRAQTVTADGAPYLAAVTPATTTFTEQAQRATVKVRYDLPLVGQLTLNVAGVPDGQSTQLHISGPNGFQKDLPGLATQTLTDLAAGTYTLTADAVRDQNFTYPATIDPSTFTVERGRTRTANVSFARDPRYGNLSVHVLGLPEGVTGTVTAQLPGGAPRSLTGSGVLTDLPVGTYTLTGADVRTNGLTYRAPSSQVQIQGATTAASDVTYAPITGRLNVVVNSPVPVPAGQISVTASGQPTRAVTATTTFDDLTPGTYGVQAQPFTAGGWTYVPTIEGAVTDVTAGNTAGATVTYVPLTARPGITLDFIAPTVTLAPTLDGNQLHGTASDASGPVKVQVYVGVDLLGEVSATDGMWAVEWPNATPDTTDVTVIATDANGNSSRVHGTVTR
ncbi:hypothetical protein [Deinococcus maricopensis]|uniref:Uncharacterized protein n=1 Tax=Deinococcus maricopensis (strain DSM 21211 / LMG 22137 / NRRL B-23946 / LB-34) TaxID=709986 RepID=E8U399_DEIML|nr:hypothetical protein [Deinococcus maricopensis]ADV66044.1 hypothetical protein Deima_0384 [Deinococcus maricopensis DSM 21211]